jgi:hypothetical protein
MIVTLTVRPTTAWPTTRITRNGAGFFGGGGVAAARITVEAVPPSGFVTIMFDAVDWATPNVQLTVSEVADTNVVAPQLPLAEMLTTELAV